MKRRPEPFPSLRYLEYQENHTDTRLGIGIGRKRLPVQCAERLFTYIAASITVMPAKAGIRRGKKAGFRVKPGMTINVKGFVTQYTRIVLPGATPLAPRAPQAPVFEPRTSSLLEAIRIRW